MAPANTNASVLFLLCHTVFFYIGRYVPFGGMSHYANIMNSFDTRKKKKYLFILFPRF